MSNKVRRINKTTTVLTWQQATDGFITFKRAQGLANSTIEDYKGHLNRFFRRYPDSWTDALRPAVLAYLSEDIAPATYNLRLEYLKVFFNYCINQELLFQHPARDLHRRRDESKIRQIDSQILTQLLKLPDQSTFAGLRDYCLLLLTMDTGIRPGEAIQLMVDDIDTANYTVTVKASVSKTRRVRMLPISPQTAKSIRKLINARHPNWPANTPVFCSYDGQLLKRNGWYQRLAIYSERLGVKVNPYSLRHSFAVMYLKNGGNAFSLQHTLGHSDMQMTKRYVNLSTSDLTDVHKIASPLNTLLNEGSRVKKLK